tara:strand:+ start:5106 stop:5519 length:414 start_codon:yes stop_codon:yes gene_type:complete
MKEVKISKLICKSNDQGSIFRIMRETDKNFHRFGEVYISTLKPNIFKGWKMHTINTTNLSVHIGEVKVVILDENKENEQVFILNSSNYKLITIPCGFWFGLKNISNKESYISNFSDFEHNPKEVINKDISFIKSKHI